MTVPISEQLSESTGLALVWCHFPLTEVSWLRFVLSGMPLDEVVASNFEQVSDNAIYVVSCNQPLAKALPKHFIERIRNTRRKGLIHLSDERFGGAYEAYTEFDFVVRNYHSSRFAHPGVLTLPLGYSPAGETVALGRLASERPFVWSFLGNINGARASMAGNLGRVQPHYCYTYDTRKPGAEKIDSKRYFDVLSNSAFCPCPMGNVNLETYRVYEALQAGCIPIVERHLMMPYFARLLPGNPIPAFTSWSRAADFVDRLSKRADELDRLQRTVSQWWLSYKSSLRATVATFCAEGLSGAFTGALRRRWRQVPHAAEQLWRVFELSRHHSAQAAMHRLSIMARRSFGPSLASEKMR